MGPVVYEYEERTFKAPHAKRVLDFTEKVARLDQYRAT